jgi:hypothetical protein
MAYENSRRDVDVHQVGRHEAGQVDLQGVHGVVVWNSESPAGNLVDLFADGERRRYVPRCQVGQK